MNDKSLVVFGTTGAPVKFQGIKGLNYDQVLNKLDEEAAANAKFPGDPLTFNGKTGAWGWGYGKKAERFDHTKFSFVFNLPYAVEGWRRFGDEGMAYGPMVPLCGGDRLPDRSTLGDTDETRWETYQDKPKDPWQRYIACPLRVDGDQRVNHIIVSGISSVIAFKDLTREFATKGRTQIGKLPIVNIDRETRENKKDKSATYEVPTFQIVDWDAPLPVDNPETAGVEQTAIPEATAQISQRQQPQAPGVYERDVAAIQAGYVADNAAEIARLQEKAAAAAKEKAAEAARQAAVVADAQIEASQRRRATSSETKPQSDSLFVGRRRGAAN